MEERIRRLLALAPPRRPAEPIRMPAHALNELFEFPVVARRPRWHWNGLWY